MVYSLGAPFVPLVIAERDIEASWTGLIFSTYAIARIFTSLIAGKVVDRCGYSYIMFTGASLMAVSVAVFSIATSLKEDWQIITLGIVLRMCQGGASGFLSTAAYSYAANACQTTADCEKVIALIECIVGIGCIIGPILGALIFELLGFEWTFIIFGILMLPACILSCFLK